MAVLVLAGSGRNAGKTAVGCALIRMLPEFRWTAVKVSPHAHGNLEPIWKERDSASDKDTSRYLAAGAERAFLADASLCGDEMVHWFYALQQESEESDGLLVESNRIDPASVAKRGKRSLSLALLGGPAACWKESLIPRATVSHALVLTGGFTCDDLPPELRHKRVFQLIPGQWSSPELLAFVRGRLIGTAS